MNTLQKWFKEVQEGSKEGQDKAALFIAGLLTAAVLYFLIMYWYTQFLRATGGVEVEPQPEVNLIESLQEKVKNVFKNEQVVE